MNGMIQWPYKVTNVRYIGVEISQYLFQFNAFRERTITRISNITICWEMINHLSTEVHKHGTQFPEKKMLFKDPHIGIFFNVWIFPCLYLIGHIIRNHISCKATNSHTLNYSYIYIYPIVSVGILYGFLWQLNGVELGMCACTELQLVSVYDVKKG